MFYSTKKSALEATRNDKQVLAYLNDMVSIHKMKSDCDSPREINFMLHQIADRSIQIEQIFKYKNVSYSTLHHVKKESAKYRPSKNLLQNTLKAYLDEELSQDLTLSKNALIISTLDLNSSIKFKFLAFDSVLNHEAVLSILRKLSNPFPFLIVYNKYRGNYFFYSKELIEQNKQIKDYYDFVQKKLLKDNLNASLIESKLNYRIIKCPLTENNKQRDYFVF